MDNTSHGQGAMQMLQAAQVAVGAAAKGIVPGEIARWETDHGGEMSVRTLSPAVLARIALLICAEADLIEAQCELPSITLPTTSKTIPADGLQTSSSVSVSKSASYTPPPVGIQIPQSPRKEYENAVNDIHWGNYLRGIQALELLASIGYVPAKQFFIPQSSFLRHPLGCYQLAQLLHSRGDILQAIEWYRISSKGGEAKSMLALSKLLITGDGDCPIDHAEALAWLHRVWTETFDPESAFLIGWIFATKHAHSENPVDTPWLTISPESVRGNFVEGDVKKAAVWWGKGADRGDYRCEVLLGELRLLGGGGMLIQRELGLKLLRNAAMSKNARAMYILGKALVYGLGGQGRTYEGHDWVKKSGQNGFRITDSGKDIVFDELKAKRAFQVIQQSADNNDNSQAKFAIGLCYRFGIGTLQNVLIGDEWIEKSGWVDNTFKFDTMKKEIESIAQEKDGKILENAITSPSAEEAVIKITVLDTKDSTKLSESNVSEPSNAALFVEADVKVPSDAANDSISEEANKVEVEGIQPIDPNSLYPPQVNSEKEKTISSMKSETISRDPISTENLTHFSKSNSTSPTSLIIIDPLPDEVETAFSPPTAESTCISPFRKSVSSLSSSSSQNFYSELHLNSNIIPYPSSCSPTLLTVHVQVEKSNNK